MAAAIIFLIPAGAILGIGAFLTNYFNFWGFDL